MIQRQIVSEILESLSYFPVVGILGSRQVGKTTLAKALRNILPKDLHYLDLESSNDLNKLVDAEQYLQQFSDKCVIIDEVQVLPNLFPLLRSLVDRHRVPARFILLGSASPFLLRENTETLAGRIAYHELSPFMLTELGEKEMRKHWLRGGFPGSYLAPSDRLANKWLVHFIDTFITRDVKRIRSVVPEAKINALMRMVAHLHGGQLNISQIANSLDVSQPLVSSYLELLEGAFLVRRLPAFFENIGKRLVKAPRIYVRDSGILHRLIGIDTLEDLYQHPQCGQSWEGYVVEQIILQKPFEYQFYYYRTTQGAEVDLVMVTPRNQKVVFEIKYSSSPVLSRGFYQSCIDLKPDAKYVVIPEGDSYLLRDDVRVISLTELLFTELGKW